MWAITTVAKEAGCITAEVYSNPGAARAALKDSMREAKQEGRLVEFWIDSDNAAGHLETYSENLYLAAARAMGGRSAGGSSEPRGVTGSEGAFGSDQVSGINVHDLRDRAFAPVQSELGTPRATVDLYKEGRSASELLSVVSLAARFYGDHHGLLYGEQSMEPDLFASAFAEEWVPEDRDDRARFFDHLGLSRNRVIIDATAKIAEPTESIESLITEMLWTLAERVMHIVIRTAHEMQRGAA